MTNRARASTICKRKAKQARKGEEEKCAFFLGGEEGDHGCNHEGLGELKRVLKYGQSQEKEAPTSLGRENECVCGCMRAIHSKIPLNLGEELFSKMNTLPHFYSQLPLFILIR